ncbi:unnamed protein product [Caenorhabditis nigoni]
MDRNGEKRDGRPHPPFPMGKGYKKSYRAPPPPVSMQMPPSIEFDPTRPPPPLGHVPDNNQQPGFVGPPVYQEAPLPEPVYGYPMQAPQFVDQPVIPIVMVPQPLPPLLPGWQWCRVELQQVPTMVQYPMSPPGQMPGYQEPAGYQQGPTMVQYPMSQPGQMSGYQEPSGDHQNPTTFVSQPMPPPGHVPDQQNYQSSSTMMPPPKPGHLHHQDPQDNQRPQNQAQQDSLPPHQPSTSQAVGRDSGFGESSTSSLVPKNSTVITVRTEIGLARYWHIRGSEYEILMPGNRGTQRVYNENPEEIIQELASRIRRGPKDRFEQMERRIEHLEEKFADLKLNSVRHSEPEMSEPQGGPGAAEMEVMDSPSNLPKIEEVVEDGSAIHSSPPVSEKEDEAVMKAVKQQPEPASSNSSPERISDVVEHQPTAEELRQKKAEEKKARMEAEQKRILEKKLEKERFKKQEKEKKRREEEERKLKKEAERIRKQKENEEKIAKEHARREQEEKEMKEKDKLQRKMLHDQKRAKRVQKKARKDQKEAEKIAEQIAENEMWEDICQESEEYNFQASISSVALSNKEIERILNDKFPKGFNVVKNPGYGILFEGAEGAEGAEGEHEETDNGGAGSSGEHSRVDGAEGSEETPILIGTHRRSSQSTIFEEILEPDELAEETEIQEEPERQALRMSRKRFSSTTYELADFDEPTEYVQEEDAAVQEEDADVQEEDAVVREKGTDVQEEDAEVQKEDADVQKEDADVQEEDADVREDVSEEVDESREEESEDREQAHHPSSAPEEPSEASGPTLEEVIPAEQIDNNTYVIIDENGVLYYEVVEEEEAEDEEDEAEDEEDDAEEQVEE